MNEIPRPDWALVEARVKKRIEVCRQQNDGDLDLTKTAALRGEIRALKWLLDLPTAVALEAGSNPPFTNGGEQF